MRPAYLIYVARGTTAPPYHGRRPAAKAIHGLGIGVFLLANIVVVSGVHAGQSAQTHLASLDKQLLLQAATAPAARVQALIRRGAHVNAQDRFGVTPLMQAVIGNNPAAVRTLIAAGANLKLRDLHGDTALDLARQLGRDDIERLLMAASTGQAGMRGRNREGT